MNRSYFTTPVFVLVALVGIFTVVKINQNHKEIDSITNTQFQQSLYYDTLNSQLLKRNNNQDSKKQGREMPESVRAIYISSWVAATPSLFNSLIDFVDNSEINAVIIDIKDSTGNISFPIEDPRVSENNKSKPRISDIKSLIENLHEKDIYVIGRLTTFQDPELAKSRPDLAFKRLDNGRVWVDKKGLAFINPKNREAWDYIVAIAKASSEIGFDEINFDYIRYPSDGNINNINYELEVGETRQSIMKEFYRHLDVTLREKGITISADVFGLVTTAKDDLGIGQVLEDILPYFDAVAPMVYPSHYASGFFNLSNPNQNPYDVVYLAMQGAMDRAIAIDEDPDKLRTWIQDFSLYGVHYGEKEVKAQIQATFDVGLDSYMVWDPKNRYTREAYLGNNN